MSNNCIGIVIILLLKIPIFDRFFPRYFSAPCNRYLYTIYVLTITWFSSTYSKLVSKNGQEKRPERAEKNRIVQRVDQPSGQFTGVQDAERVRPDGCQQRPRAHTALLQLVLLPGPLRVAVVGQKLQSAVRPQLGDRHCCLLRHRVRQVRRPHLSGQQAVQYPDQAQDQPVLLGVSVRRFHRAFGVRCIFVCRSVRCAGVHQARTNVHVCPARNSGHNYADRHPAGVEHTAVIFDRLPGCRIHQHHRSV